MSEPRNDQLVAQDHKPGSSDADFVDCFFSGHDFRDGRCARCGTKSAATRSRVRVRLLLAKFWGEDETPAIISAVDASVWEHWEDADEKAWRDAAHRSWGLDPSDCEWVEVWAEFDPDALRKAFVTPIVEGTVDA